MEYIENAGGVVIPKKGTSSYLSFKKELIHSELITLLFFWGEELMRENEAKIRNKFKEILDLPGNEYFKDKLSNEDLNSGFNSLIDMSNYELHYGQMCFARTMDNVVSYFKDILKEVIQKCPEVITSGDKTESIEFIMSYDSIEELKFALIDKKIESLFYKNIDKIEKYFKNRLNIDLFESDYLKEDFNEAIKIRNIIVHNRGIVNQSFFNEFPDPDFPVGTVIKITYEQLSIDGVDMSNFVTSLDDKIATKFDLERFDIYPQT